MLYDYLAEFVYVARDKSFTKAARKLSISQSVLSRHVSALETDLGVSLLDRNTHGVRLTEEGDYVFERASEIIEIANSIEHRFDSTSRSRVLTVSGVLENTHLAKAVKTVASFDGFRKELASVRVISDEGFSSITENLDSNNIDIYFTFSSNKEIGALSKKRYEVVQVYEEHLYAAVKADHPSAKEDRITLGELAHFEIAHFEGNYLHSKLGWEELVQTCLDSGFYPKSKSFIFDSPVDLFSMDLGD